MMTLACMATLKRMIPVTVLSAATLLWQPVAAETPEPQSATETSAQSVKEHSGSRKPRFLLHSNPKTEVKAVDVEGSETDMEEDSVNGRRRSRRSREAEFFASDSVVSHEMLQPERVDSVHYAGAHIEFEDTVWDFGDIARKGGDVVKNFEFENNGSKPLVITGITMSCTCISVDYPKRPVPAGGRGRIKLVYEPHKMSPGTFYRVVQVHSNSSDGVRLLTVHGNSIDARRLD